MKTNFTKFRPLALILAIALLIGLVPFTALADEELDAAINAEGGLLEFVTEGDYPWVVATDDATGRTYAKSSNEGVNSSSSALSLDISLDEETNIRFDFIAAGEGSSTAWDKCIFAVDGEAVFTYGAHNTTWETYFGSIEAGEHTLTWTYTKDSSVNPTGDYFAIDNFMLNATIPTYELYIGRTQADMTNADDILGDGVFSYNAGTNTLYIDGDYHDEETAVTSYIEGLTVSISYDSEISSTGGNAFLLFAGTIFTGKGTLYATSEQAPAINLNARESFVEFYSAHAYLSGSAAISTGGAGNTLYIIYSGIEAEGEEQAVYGFDSIWVEGEIIVEPKDGSFGEDNVYVDDDPADYFLLEPATTDIYAICTYDYGNTYTGSFITFNTGDITSFDLIGDAPGAYAAAYAYGRILVLDTTGNYYIINIDNGETVEIDEAFDVDDYGTPTSMTYDYSSDTLYVVTSLGNDRYLLQLDPASAEVLDAESLGSYNAFGICADPDGILFLACGDGTVYLYDTYTGDLDDLAEVADIEAQPSYVQDICYDFDNDLIYWAFINSSTNGLYRISPKDGGYELLGKLGSRGAELTGMFTIPSEEPETPSEITDIAFAASEVTVHKGKSVKLGIAVTPFTAEGYEIDFSTEDEDIISVDENGVVTGLKVGIAEVKATVVGTEITDYCTVSVIPGPLVGFYFEEDPADEGWTFVDADEDGYNWGWNLDAAVNLKVFEGEGIIFSQSYDNTEGTALEPDNWAVSPAFDLSEATGTAYVTLYARGQDDSYAEEVFQIYAGTTPDIEEMDPISEEFTATDEYEQYRGNLTDFIGEETVYVAIRHYDVTDMFYLNVDAVEIWAPSADDVFLPIDMALTPYYNTIHAGETVQLKLSVYPDYAMGYEVTYEISDKEVVDLDPDTGIVTGLKEGRVTITAYITDTELSSEVVVTVLPPLGDLVAGFYFEDEDEVEEWTFIDDDEDGNNWIWSLTDAQPFDAYEGEGIIYSNSYINDVGAVTPDNWAITPAIELPEGISTVTLWAKGQDADWCEEIFAIYAGTTPDIDDMEQVSEIYIASDEYERYEADLSDFAGGTVYVAIRHFEVTDQYILDVDCVEIWCNGNIASVDTAEIAGTYVAEYNMPLPGYENIKMGDLNGNGEVDASDYLKVKRNVLGTYDLNDTEFLAADIDFNGTIEASDYLKIKRKVLGTYELPEVPSITQEYSLRVKGDGTATMLVSSADDEDLKGYAYIIPITIEPAENGTWTFYFHETVFVGEGEPQEQITAYTFELTETGCRLGRGDKWLEFTRLDDDIK